MDTPNVQQLPRTFKVGSQRIVENDTTINLSNEEMRNVLKSQYPEVANATVSERSDGTTRLVEFLPQPGRKG